MGFKWGTVWSALESQKSCVGREGFRSQTYQLFWEGALEPVLVCCVNCFMRIQHISGEDLASC